MPRSNPRASCCAMEDGSYDIFGNAIPADGVAASAPAAEVAVETTASKKKSGVGWTPPAAQSGFTAGAAVEVKEGGSKWRAGVVTGADAKAKTVDVKYDDDGEIEPEIPANLVRLREGASGPSPSPAQPAEPAAKAATSGRKERTRVSRQAVKDCLKNPKVVSILEIVATLSERELDSAVAMMRALDAVRPQPDGLAGQSS